MKITIDTKEDSPDDIKKVMQILTHFVGSNSLYSNSSNLDQGRTEAVDTTSMMNMFGENDSGTTSLSKTERDSGTPPDFSSFLNLTTKKLEKKEEVPKIEFF